MGVEFLSSWDEALGVFFPVEIVEPGTTDTPDEVVEDIRFPVAAGRAAVTTVAIGEERGEVVRGGTTA